jgi:nitric oxide reductase NorD protein
MTFIRDWFNKQTKPPQKRVKARLLESRQTGSCGGMSTTELKIRIELILDGIKTKDSIMGPVTELAALSHALQTQFLAQLSELSELSIPHAYSVMLVYTPAIRIMDKAEHKQWLEHILLAIRSNQLDEANSLINNYSEFNLQINKSTTLLLDVSGVLEKLIFSITQQELALISLDPSTDQSPYTIGKSIFLPESISLFDNYQDNYLLYKVMVFQLLGQIQLQTNTALKEIEQGVIEYGDHFLDTFSSLETLRINHFLKNKFPGIWKNILSIHKKLAIDTYPEHIFSDQAETSVFDSVNWIREFGIKHSIFNSLPYQSDFSPKKLSKHIHDASLSQASTFMMNKDKKISDITEDNDNQTAERLYFKHNNNSQPSLSTSQSYTDIWQDLAENIQHHQAEQKLLREEQKQNSYLYPEWDISLKQYRTNWCRVKEIAKEQNITAPPITDELELRFFEQRIRKSLDLIINDQKLIRNQPDGDDIDIDAWVAASSNKTKYADDFQNIYIRNNKNSRSIAILFAVDISGSTAGWKNKIIKQSTWLLSRTLANLNDQYAIYAFSGSGRENCHIYPVKTFDESYNNDVKHRIFSLKPQQYTRMGAAIRHLSKTLKQSDAKTKILFVLTDGKPDDIDGYRGDYGIEDTRRAFNEVKALHITPFVLTFDKEAMDYLPYMLGKKHFRLISDITMLPIQISTIYKQLTT